MGEGGSFDVVGERSQLGGTRTSRLFMQDEWRPGLYYHVIGKAVPGEWMFREEAEYRRFLRKSLRDQYGLIFQIYAYCLPPNHFHVAARTLYGDEIRARLAGLRRALRPHQRA